MKANIQLIRLGVAIGLTVVALLTGCSSNPTAMTTTDDESLLSSSPVNPAIYPFAQDTPAPGRW